MFAQLVINVAASLTGTFHYHVPHDLEERLQVGHLVEVEFGRRLAQGIVIALDENSPVEETKPIIGLIDEAPVVRPWQIALAHWLSREYLAPLNACLRLMLPPGLTRWADVTLDLAPRWEGAGRLTEVQQQLVELLQQRGDLRGRQIGRAMPKKSNWKAAAEQLVRRGILRKASVLDPPRARPKIIRTAELSAGPARVIAAAVELGRANKQSEILHYLATVPDPLPAEADTLAATGAGEKHLQALAEAGLIQRTPAETIAIPTVKIDEAPAEYRDALRQLPAPVSTLLEDTLAALQAQRLVHLVAQPAAVSLAMPPRKVAGHIYRLRRAEKYYDILNHLAQAATAVPLSELYAATDSNMSHLRKLERLELIRFGQEEVWRDPLADRDFVPAEPPLLTPDQARVWGRIKMAMIGAGEEKEGVTRGGGDKGTRGGGDKVTRRRVQGGAWTNDKETRERGEVSPSPPLPLSPTPILLHGVTGSGKTEIYMRAIDFALKRGQRAVVLVPEIALTPQTVRRFAARFPGQVAILHSRLSDGERYDTWRRARQGAFDIVVGPRSALFAPLEKVGVIVVDEEHDNSYKQTPPVPPPYYHARDTAIELGRITGAMVILGSATPDLVTFHRAQAGRYRLLELPKRIMGHRQRITSQASRLQRDGHSWQETDESNDALTIPLPPIQIVDMRQELRAGNRGIFSRPLVQAMEETLGRGEQAILFLNRRGTATFVMCRDCGLVLKCPRCEMPLTYHRPGMLLECHYCGRKQAPPQECPQCGSHRIKYFGLGTEEVERLVQQQWPTARTVRWDRDTTAGRDTHEALLASFINQEADILVGTQMIAKGLDLPLVTLVGVISADVSLGLPDYRTGERTFQILAQVAGRAGRGLLGGRVVIQTYQPEHYAIQTAAEHDFTGFYIEEIRFRTQHSLPPFRRMARLIVADPVSDRAERQANELAKMLRQHIRDKALGATEILGPTPPFFSRIDGRYRWHIIIRSPDPVRLLEDFHVPPPWIVDVDPVSTL
ncbi:MAG: primosomal protein N' [Chloroflexi bacterium]|nr:primosomal protein N' [Chloroflexota bacterium]